MGQVSKLRRIREARGLLLSDVAAAVDCDPGSLSRIEAGTRRPAIDVARRLFEYYDGEISLGEIHDVTFDPTDDVLEPA